MTGRVIIVTGASAGLGYEVARYLCEGGNDVVLACRNEEKANRAIEKIKRQNPNALATFMQLDLASLESVRKFVDDFHASGKKLHVLINNAGVAMNPKDPKRQYTKENFELTMGTNHLGHFLLTNLLLDDLKATGGDGGNSRIVTVASSMHDPEANRRSNLRPLDFDNFFLFIDGAYNGMQAYKNSKLANIMFTYELARRLEGTGVTANCVCPGFIPGTDLIRSISGAKKFFLRYVVHGALRFTKVTRSVQQGASAICTLATDDKYKEVNGKYIKEAAETKSSEESLSEENQKKLWELSGGYVQLEGYEPIEVPPPPVEEEKPKKEEKKEEGEASKEGAEETVEDKNKTDDDKKDDTKVEGEEKKEEEEEKEEKKEEAETKEEKQEEEKPAEKPESENKEEEKKE